MKNMKNIIPVVALSFSLSIGVVFAGWQAGEGGGPNYVVGSFEGNEVEPVARINQTYYSSIEKAIDDGVLEMCYPSSYLHEYDGTVISIIQDNTTAWVDPNLLTISYVGASSSYVPSGAYTTGLPTNAGYYVVKIAATNGYEVTHTINCRIAPKIIYIKDICSYSLDYNSSARTSATLFNTITNLQFTDNQSTQATYNFTSYVIAGMDNGMYYYPNSAISSSQPAIYASYVNSCNAAGFLTGPQANVNNIIGSTYAVKVVSTNSNYEIGNRCILKYKTANVAGTLYTIEDAINASGTTTISFAGNSTNSTSYVATCFCALVDDNPYSSDRNYTANKTIVVNYQDGTSVDYGTSPKSIAAGNVYSALIVPSNVTLTISSGYSLVANAVIGYTQPNTSVTLTRGVILNHGTINIEGKIYAYGFIKGDGIINCVGSSQVYEVLRTFDWPGGNTASSTYSKLVPMNAWSVHNISCKTKIVYGSKMYSLYYGYEGQAVATPLILSSSISENSIFVMKTGSYVIKSAANAAANPSSQDLTNINGSNQTRGQKDIMELYGQIIDGNFSLSMSISGFSGTIATSTSIGCPVGYMDVTLKGNDENGNNAGTLLSITKSDFIFLPGTKLTVEAGASLSTGTKADLIFETVNHITQSTSNYSFGTLCVDKVDAKMILNGSFTSNGSIGGLVITESASATLTTGSGFTTTTFYSLLDAKGLKDSGPVAYSVTNMYSKAYINQSSTLSNFVASASYTSNGTYFIGTAGTASNLDGTYKGNAINACLLPDTLVSMADGTKKAVKDLVPGDLVLVMNHETGQIDVAPVTFNDHEEATLMTVLYLNFSNGKSVGIITEHGFFDLDTMKYEYIREDNYSEFIGHRFYTEEGGEAILTSVNVSLEYTECYSPTSFFHFDYFVEGMLSMPGGITGLFNIFEYGENLKYDEEAYNRDVEMYGLFTHEDLAPLGVTEIMFEAYAGKYLKVALGKGVLTEEYLAYLIERYGGFTEGQEP